MQDLRFRQPNAPYLDAVIAHAFRGSLRFHVPGHKGGPGADPGFRNAIGVPPHAFDLPQDIEGIDLGPVPTPYQLAELLAAQAYGAQRAWFLTNGATQGNHALCLALAALGSSVVVQRNAHASVIDGLVLSGGYPTFVAPVYNQELGMAHGVTPDSIDQALKDAPDARAVFIVSPTYYGLAADVAGCAEVCHAAGAALVVDCAWGPHFGFHPGLPQSPLSLGADAVLVSMHKLAGSLTQSAILLTADSPFIDSRAIARAVRLVRSTSQSALLLASLDGARRQLVVHGQAILERTLAAAAEARRAINALDCCAVVGEEFVGQPGVASWDPLRLVIDVRQTGCFAHEIAERLRDSLDVHVELATDATLVLVLGIAEQPEALEQFVHDFEQVVSEMKRPTATTARVRPPTAFANEIVMLPRDAFLGSNEVIAVGDAIGRISADSIAGYPPGIPALLPGERITEEAVTYLRDLRAAGGRLHGATDPDFHTICVVAE